MYDVHKSVGGESKGRMQQAVEEWEKSAKAASEKDDSFDDEVKDIIKHNMSSMNGRTIEPEEQTKRIDAPVPADDLEEKTAAQTAEPDGPAKPEAFYDTKATGEEAGEKENVRVANFNISSNNNEVSGVTPDFESEEQAQDIYNDQLNLQYALAFRFAGCAIITALLVFLAAAPVIGIPLPLYVNASTHPEFYIAANLLLLFIAGILGFSIAVKGIASLIRLKADADGLTSLSFFAAFFGGCYILYHTVKAGGLPPATEAVPVFAACASAGLSLNLLGKVFLIARVKCNLRFISSPQNIRSGFYSAVPLDKLKAQGLMRTFRGEPEVVSTQRVRFLTNFLERSYTPTPSDSVSKVFAPVALIAALLAAAAEYVLNGRDLVGAVTVFTAICCVASPIMLEAGVAIPFYFACRRLAKDQVLITGYDDVSHFGATDAIAADAGLIFPGRGTRIYGVKTFSGHDVEEAVLFSSSITNAAGSPLYKAFMEIFSDVGSGKKLMRAVEKIEYEDDRGLSAIIDGKVVLLGNRRLLRHHLIESPSRDYEARYAVNGKDVVYLAVNGEICAMFIVGYDISQKVTAALRKTRKSGIRVLVSSSDPNISQQLIEDKCEQPLGNVFILGSKEMKLLEDGGGGGDGRRRSGLAFKDISGFIAAVSSCIKLKGTLLAVTALQVVLSIIGVLFIVYTSFFGNGAAKIAPAYLLAYQFLVSVPVLLLFFRKNV